MRSISMQFTFVAPFPNCNCYIPFSSLPHHSSPHIRLKPSSCNGRLHTHSSGIAYLTLSTSNNCDNEELRKYRTNNDYNYDPSLLCKFHYSFNANNINEQNSEDGKEYLQLQTQEEEAEFGNLEELLTTRWWTDMKAALGQRINIEGIVSSVGMFVKDQHLALAHVAVPDIRYIDWTELHRRGFKGVVFDKDNTITVPYSLTLWGPLRPSVEQCKAVFGNNIAVFSNSAGLFEYDHNGSKARELEKVIGIKVIRHKVKKPAGTAEEIEIHFGCKASELIMVGDRPFTDVLYGNRNGFLTIQTDPLSHAEEPLIVRQVRKLEVSLTNYWRKRGLKPADHNLLPDPLQCIKDPPCT